MTYEHNIVQKLPSMFLIAGICAGIVGVYSSHAMAVADVEAISPGTTVESAQISDLSPTFSWSESHGATGYTLAVFETALGENRSYKEQADLSELVIFIRFSSPTLSWTPSSESELLYDVPYVWYVRPTTDDEVGQWSGGKLFSINSTQVEQVVADAITAQLSDENTVKQIARALNALPVTYTASQVLPVPRATAAQSGVNGETSARGVASSLVEVERGTASPRSGSFHFNVQSPSYLATGIQSSDFETVLELGNTSATGRNWWMVTGGTGGSFPGGKFGIYDRTAITPRLTIDKLGNVGIGTTSPSEKLDVSGNISATNTIMAKGSGGLSLDCYSASVAVTLSTNNSASVAVHSGSGTGTATTKYCGGGYSVFQSRCSVAGLPTGIYLSMAGIYEGVAHCAYRNESGGNQNIIATARCCIGSW